MAAQLKEHITSFEQIKEELACLLRAKQKILKELVRRFQQRKH